MDTVKKMHTHFGINYEGHPRPLTKEEYIFRASTMMEELLEYIDSIFEDVPGVPSITEQMDQFRDLLNELTMRKTIDLGEQFDALLDLSVFIQGTCELQGFPYLEGMEEVMAANMKKRLATSAAESKRNLKFDLVKPQGWQPPDLNHLVYPSGLIILDGPDGTGKSQLAEDLASRYNGRIIHHTWNEELELRVPAYYKEALDQVFESNQLIIIDRLYLSNIIYHQTYRADRNYKWHDEMVAIKNLVQELGAVEIVCLPEDKLAFLSHYDELMNDREEMYSHSMDLVYDGYMHHTLNNDYIFYDLFQNWHSTDNFVESMGVKLKW